jgi:hypothetical protein
MLGFFVAFPKVKMAFPLAPIRAGYHVARKAGIGTPKMPKPFAPDSKKNKTQLSQVGFFVLIKSPLTIYKIHVAILRHFVVLAPNGFLRGNT